MKGLRIIVVIAGILVALIAFTRAFGSDEKTFPLHAYKLVEAFASAPEMQTTIAATKKVEW